MEGQLDDAVTNCLGAALILSIEDLYNMSSIINHAVHCQHFQLAGGQN